MSHRATNWAIQQRGLKPAAKLLLWQLADRHNSDTGRCDPSQDRLADDCEMSRASINRHLEALEQCGLIRRIQRHDVKSRRRCSTSYELALDGPFPVSQFETRAMSQNDAEPCLKMSESHVSNCDTNPVREPGREPVCAETSEQDFGDSDRRRRGRAENDERLFETYWTTHPRPHDRIASKSAWTEALASGVDAAVIVRAAAAYAAEQRGNSRQYIKCSDTWLTDRRWRDHADEAAKPVGKVASLADAAHFWAAKIKDKRPISSNAISTSVAAAMIEMRLVTTNELRAAGVAT